MMVAVDGWLASLANSKETIVRPNLNYFCPFQTSFLVHFDHV